MIEQIGTIISYLTTFFSAFIIGLYVRKMYVGFNRGEVSSIDAKEFIRKTLRIKPLVGRDLGKYALYVSPTCIKVALARDYQLALLAGMNDFWECVPASSNRDTDLATSELERNLNNCERCLALIYDGHGNTLVSGRCHIVPDGYTCSSPSPEEVCEIIRHAKSKTGGRKRNRSPIHN